MKTHRKIVRLVFGIAIIAFAGCSSAKADCDSLLKQFDSAISARNLSATKNLEVQIIHDNICGSHKLDVQKRRAALELVLAQQLMDAHASLSEYQDLIVDADEPEVLWRAAVGLGDIRFSQRRFAEATVAYERAIEIIKNKGTTPVDPKVETIKAVFDRAVESKMLAANEETGAGGSKFVPAAKDGRDGTVGGSMSADMRGFTPASVPIPIRFETGSAKFTTVGEQAAKELLDALREQKAVNVTLVGHTDERGEAGYNMQLSDQRVKAVADYLRRGGITAKITTVAKGKSEPLQLPDLSDLSREDLWALNRRVVWQRN
jgi:outer membrane protein OmpA-like peptidoglycan-associated protein